MTKQEINQAFSDINATTKETYELLKNGEIGLKQANERYKILRLRFANIVSSLAYDGLQLEGHGKEENKKLLIEISSK